MSRAKTAIPRVIKLARPIPVNPQNPGKEVYTHEVVWTVDGRRYRRRYQTKMQAQVEANALRNQLVAAGGGALALRPGDAEDLAEMRRLLAPFGVEPLAVVREWTTMKSRELASVSIEDAVRDFLTTRERDGLRHRSLQSLRGAAQQFQSRFSGAVLSAIGSRDIETWLTTLPTGGLTKRSLRTRLGTFLAFCARRGWCRKGIIDDVPVPKIQPVETEVFTVAEAQALLTSAREVAPSLLPYLTLGLFCGLRTAELDRIPWEHVGDKEVRIEAATAKTASRRVVPIPENAASWITPYRKKHGPIRPKNARRMLAKVLAVSGVKWKTNAMRHSFASYRLAQCNDAPRVSLELGHTSPALVFRHYRALVSEAEAGRFFAIAP
ncbi:tyrosine-type recombinase/integrase [Verrucomicrobium sp. 3C]|uniref:tyrosine-type recombinase/integrase n=1 Tax=Verrucomicrobium sp. 3C TaxID=1134055 RepID=UPI00039C6AF5|nr:tyrosine-type recombinase/integrase [Verrucomicrobium sp. 3C]